VYDDEADGVSDARSGQDDTWPEGQRIGGEHRDRLALLGNRDREASSERKQASKSSATVPRVVMPLRSALHPPSPGEPNEVFAGRAKTMNDGASVPSRSVRLRHRLMDPHFQPGTRPACLTHPCISGIFASSRVFTLT
jgi:hypothetical protein